MVPTLAIIHPDLPGAKMIINEADYDPTVHQLYGETSSPEEPRKRKRSPKQTPKGPEDLSPEQTPNPSEDQLSATPALSEEQSPEPISDEPQEQPPGPISDLPENLSPELTPNGPEDQPSPTPALSEVQPPTYSQSDLEAKNLTALRAIAAEKRIPRRMKLSRDELIEAILGGVGNGE